MSEIGMMYVREQGGFLHSCRVSSTSLSVKRCLATASKASTSEFAAVPPEKTQTPFVTASATAASPFGAKAAVGAKACMGDDEPGDAVRPIDVARIAAGRMGVPMPSSIAVRDVNARRSQTRDKRVRKECRRFTSIKMVKAGRSHGCLFMSFFPRLQMEGTRS